MDKVDALLGRVPENCFRKSFEINADDPIVTIFLEGKEVTMMPEEIQLEMDEEVRKLCEERAIKDEEIRQVIQQGEATGDKLYQPGTDRYLTKLKMKEPTTYVDYSPKEGRYIIHAAYWHYSEFVAKDKVEEIQAEVQPMAEGDKVMVEKWHCFKCKEKMGEAAIALTFLDVQGAHSGIECPKCGAAYILEQTVVEVVRPNEDELDAK